VDISFNNKEFFNPQGLNEILSDLLNISIDEDADWAKDIPTNIHLGPLKKNQVMGRINQFWGEMWESYAFTYLNERLSTSGWVLNRNYVINGVEYDIVGWYNIHENEVRSPDLVIEMYCPHPKDENSYEFKYILKKQDKIIGKLENIQSKYKYFFIGVPRNMKIRTVEREHSEIKVIYQEYRFRYEKIEPRKKV
jgi:hypothetical protein